MYVSLLKNDFTFSGLDVHSSLEPFIYAFSSLLRRGSFMSATGLASRKISINSPVLVSTSIELSKYSSSFLDSLKCFIKFVKDVFCKIISHFSRLVEENVVVCQFWMDPHRIVVSVPEIVSK